MSDIRPIDGDGHVVEIEEELCAYLDAKYTIDAVRSYGFFPSLDGWPRGVMAAAYDIQQDAPNAEQWGAFLTENNFDGAVMYPSAGLGVGWIRDKGWSREITRAYNDYLYDGFTRLDPRLHGVALLPLQDADAAAAELRRAVRELGMVGGMLPANGLRRPFGDTFYDPVYDEAQSLGVMLGAHGAPQTGLGFDFFDDFKPGSVLAHPFSQMIQFTSMWFGGVFQRFPQLKVAFLEAGSGWVPYLAERIGHKAGQDVLDGIREHPLYFHLEIDERTTIDAAIEVAGADRLIYASDYPHDRADEVIEDLEAFLHREDLDDDVKRKVLRDNSEALYGLRVPVS